MASCSFISLCRTATNSMVTGHSIVTLTVVIKLVHICFRWNKIPVKDSQIEASSTTSTTGGWRARAERQSPRRPWGVSDKTGSHLDSSTFWQNLHHSLICKAPPRLCGGSARCWMGQLAAPKAWIFNADPKCHRQQSSLLIFRRENDLGREYAGAGAFLRLFNTIPRFP